MSIQRAGLPRRSVVRGAVWAAPAIVVANAVPAYAAASTPAVDVAGVVDWDSGAYAYTSPLLASYVVNAPPDTQDVEPLTLDISHARGSNTKTGTQLGTSGGTADLNLRVSTVGVGDTGAAGLTLHQAPVDNSLVQYDPSELNRSATTFTFSRPVTDLSFTICGIDWAGNDFIDGVSVVGAESDGLIHDLSKISTLGVGVPLEEIYCANDWVAPLGPTAASVSITVPSAQSFSVGYWHMVKDPYDPAPDRDQQVYLSDFAFTYPSHAH